VPYADSEVVQIGTAKAQLLKGQPSTAWGEETTIAVRCVDTDDGNSASHWFGIFRDYAKHAGADAVGRLENGEPWVRDASRSAWPVDSNVVEISYGSEHSGVADVWALVTGIGDESDPPYVYEPTVSFVPLAAAADYADRTALLDAIATPSVQL